MRLQPVLFSGKLTILFPDGRQAEYEKAFTPAYRDVIDHGKWDVECKHNEGMNTDSIYFVSPSTFRGFFLGKRPTYDNLVSDPQKQFANRFETTNEFVSRAMRDYSS